MKRKLLIARVTLLVCWVCFLGFFLCYPKPNTSADLPGSFTKLYKESNHNKELFQQRLLRSRRNLARQKLMGYAGKSDMTTEDRLIAAEVNFKQELDQWRKRYVGAAPDPSSDVKTVRALYLGKGLVPSDASLTPEAQMAKSRYCQKLFASILAEAQDQVRRDFLSLDECQEYSRMAGDALRNGRDRELELMLLSLKDPEYGTQLALTRVKDNPKVIIVSESRGMAKGYITDYGRTLVIPFVVESSSLPSISAEARRWRAAHSKTILVAMILLFALGTLLISVERSLFHRRSDGYGEFSRNTDALGEFRRNLQDRRMALAYRKAASPQAGGGVALKRRSVREVMEGESFIYSMALLASLAACAIFFLAINPKPPKHDKALHELTAEKIRHREFTIVEYDY